MTIESHKVNVAYQEKYSEAFQKLTATGNLAVKSIKPTSPAEAEFFLSVYVAMYNFDDYSFWAGACNEDYTTCDIYLDKGNTTVETHVLNVSYSDVDQEVLTKVNSLIDALPEDKHFIVEDLELINYLVSSGYDMYGGSVAIENAIINYSSEIKNYFGNMTAHLDARAGWGGNFNSGAFGGFVVSYEGTIYGLLNGGGAEKNHVIYIPDDTENTTEAYVKAAQTRINNYLKNDKVKITYGGKLSEDFIVEEYEHVADTSKIRDEYYMLTYGENVYPFLIVKDSSKINDNVTYATNDIMTNVSITSGNSSIPLDTAVKVNEIKKEHKTYQEYTSKLGVKDALMYD